VFTATPAMVVLQADQPRDEQAVRQTLTEVAGNLWTFAGIGAGWTEHLRGTQRWYSCEGPAHLNFAVSRGLLLLANSGADVEDSLARLSAPANRTDVVYRALFRHAQERGGYDRIMGMLDSTSAASPDGMQSTRWPFFSSDLASLSAVFARVAEVQVEIRDAGSGLRERVRYRMR
jgi:hypothetical protein